MRSVSIVGVGCTPFKDFEEHPETQGIGEGEAFGYAALEAIADAGLEPRDIDFFYHGSANPYLVGDCITPNMQVADWFGVRAKGSVHHSEACCTGYVALEQAVMAVAVPSRFFRKLIEAASAPPCSSPPPSCSARPSPPASTCPGTSSCPIRAPRCTSASPSPASGPSCRPGRSLRLSSSA